MQARVIFTWMFSVFLRVVRLSPYRRRSYSLEWMLETLPPSNIREVRVPSTVRPLKY